MEWNCKRNLIFIDLFCVPLLIARHISLPKYFTEEFWYHQAHYQAIITHTHLTRCIPRIIWNIPFLCHCSFLYTVLRKVTTNFKLMSSSHRTHWNLFLKTWAAYLFSISQTCEMNSKYFSSLYAILKCILSWVYERVCWTVRWWCENEWNGDDDERMQMMRCKYHLH